MWPMRNTRWKWKSKATRQKKRKILQLQLQSGTIRKCIFQEVETFSNIEERCSIFWWWQTTGDTSLHPCTNHNLNGTVYFSFRLIIPFKLSKRFTLSVSLSLCFSDRYWWLMADKKKQLWGLPIPERTVQSILLFLQAPLQILQGVLSLSPASFINHFQVGRIPSPCFIHHISRHRFAIAQVKFH